MERTFEMRLGLYGGTFDPIHMGHLLVAETCREAARLDQVWFIPAATSPHKATRETTSGNQRVAMLQLAIGGHPSFHVCELELDRGGLSYTVETLELIHTQHPNDELFFLMGGDSLIDLPLWKAPQRICELATPLVVARPDAPEPDFEPLTKFVDPNRLKNIREQQVTMPQIDLSSTEIRSRVTHGKSIRYRLPRAVEKYIAAEKLYQAPQPQ